MKYAASVEYDGSAFHGWQRQPDAHSVQEAVESAISCVANCPIQVVCAGRTDAGVHGLSQVIHFDSPHARPTRAWVQGANSQLPHAVSLRWAMPIDTAFDARRSAIMRHYRYLLYVSDTRPALLARRVLWVYRALDIDTMQQGAAHLVGEHDFSAFRSAHCQFKHPVRKVSEIRISRRGELIAIDIKANAFLYNMVRIIVGTLIHVGAGMAEPSWVSEVLRSRDRTCGGMTVPSQGLYFVTPTYPARFAIPTITTDLNVLSVI